MIRMNTLGTSLLNTLNSALKLPIAEYMQNEYMDTFSIEEVLSQLELLQETIEEVPDGIDAEYRVVVKRLEYGLEDGKPNHGLSLKRPDEDDLYGVTFVPFSDLFRYSVVGYEEDAEVIGDIIWDITFDGWTEEEQAKRIEEFQESIDSDDSEYELF